MLSNDEKVSICQYLLEDLNEHVYSKDMIREVLSMCETFQILSAIAILKGSAKGILDFIINLSKAKQEDVEQ